MNIALWIVQVLLGIAFMFFGFMKGFSPLSELAAQMPWVADSPGWLVRFIAFSEIAGGLGLILPAATRIKPSLTPLAALGLLTIMVLAAGTHAVRSEFGGLLPNFMLAALAAFIAWGRLKKVPIKARGMEAQAPVGNGTPA